MQTDPASAAAAALAAMTVSDVVRFVAARPDTPWLRAALAGMVVPADAGVFWVLLPDDVGVWPVRVMVCSCGGERHEVWLTYQWPVGGDHVVITREGVPLLNPLQAGDAGRAWLVAWLAGAGQLGGNASP